MSFISRLLRKAPSVSPVPASTPRPAPSAKAGPSALKQGVADRALTAAAEEGALQAAIDAGDVQAIARLVVAGTSTKVRQSAAHAIDDPEVLRQLIRDARGNDKGVYKILTTKRDLLVEQTRKFEQLQAEIAAASRDLEQHSRRAYDATFGPKLDQFEIRWESLAEQADAELRGNVQQWIERSRATIAEHRQQATAQAARELEAANAAAEAQRLREQQEQASAAAAAEQQLLVDEQNRALAEKRQVEQRAVREIDVLIRKARGALSDGNSSRAASVRRAVEEKLAAAPPLPADLAGRLQQLDKQLDELKDWKSFSVTPKRAELIEEMESLVGAPLDPPALADRIKGLKEEWRTLGKGASEDIEADRQRFQEAAKNAYQPCVEYFAAQALILEENLRHRDALLTKFAAFEANYDWEQPDWRTVISTLREMKEEWRRCPPVDRSVGKQRQETFATVIASVQGRLDAEYTRNLKQKESLIERSRQLLASEDVRKAIDAIKKLQQEWQTVGPVPREVDQRLWGKFRQHCDAVFQKREMESASYSAGLENNKAQAVALCEQLENLAALESPDRTSLIELRTAFEALGEFPRADTRDLRSRFDRGVERFEASIARRHALAAERGWNDLFEAADLVRAYRLAMARGEQPEQLDALKGNAETYIASVPRLPKSGLQALKQALACERSEDLDANETALKMLCIRAEILTDMPTPPEDQVLRREYQLQRLVQNMGRGVGADETDLDTLAIEWVVAGPVDQTAYQPLLQRFRSSRALRNSKAR
jgi:hypothetical protein